MNETYGDKVVDLAIESWLDEKVKTPRKHRFTLDSKAFRLEPWVASATYSIKPKLLTCVVNEAILSDGTNPVMNYLVMLGKDSTTHTDHFTLSYYDENGKVLGRIAFDKCALVEHVAGFAYGTSKDSLVQHKLVFNYQKCKYYSN